MEPLDTAKNDENVGSSKRRISSILKAARTSTKLSDSDQVESQVEVAKPVEKRTSRRVSFAPADNVHVFPKDAKNDSPVQSPLRNLPAVENPNRRIQMGVTEEGIQPVNGMETLLKAPLHASQQNKTCFMDNRNTEDYGEKTVMFTDDASMDVTHSQTVIINNDSESPAVLPDPDCVFLPSCGNMDLTSSVVSRKADTHGQSSSSIHGLDPEFENFLSTISKQSVPRANTLFAKAECNTAPSLQETVGVNVLDQLKTQWAGMDKENRTPDVISAVMEKTLRKTEKIGEPFNRSVIFQGDGECMDMTGSIVGITADDNPLQCLFPALDLCQESGNQYPLKMTLGQQGPEPLGCTSSNSVGMGITNKPTAAITPKLYGIGVSSVNKTRRTGGLNLRKVPTVSERGMMTHSAHSVHSMSSRREVASNNPSILDSDEMEIKRSQTVAIDAKSFYIDSTVQNKKQRLPFMTDSSKTSEASEGLNDMEMTRCQTRIIEEKNNMAKPTLNIGTIESVRISKDDRNLENMFQQGDSTKYTSSKSNDMELTQSHTVAIDAKSLLTGDPLLNKKRKRLVLTKAISTREDECSMDLTKPLTVLVDQIPLSDGSKVPPMPLERKLCKKDYETVTSTLESDSDDMEFTRCQTRVIEAKNLDVVKPMLSVDKKTARIPRNDSGTNKMLQQVGSTKYSSWESDDMEITKSQTVAIDAKSLHTVNESQNKKRKSLSLRTTTTTCASKDECKTDCETVTSTLGADSDDMEFTRCQTRMIEAKHLDVVKPMLSLVSEEPFKISGNNSVTDEVFQQGGSTKYSSWESDDMEITKSQTVAIDAKSLHTVNESQNKKRKSLSLRTTTTTCASKDGCDMVMTKPLTASVGHFTLPLQIKLCKTDCETVTSTLGADSDDMEFTRCQTRMIEAKNLDVVKAMLSADKKTVGISGDDSGTDKMFQQEGSTKYSSWESDDMEITKSQTVAIDAKSLHTVNESQNKKRKSLSLKTTTTTCASKDECDMVMTKPLTASVDHFTLSGGSKISNLPLQIKLCKTDCETVTSTLGADSDDMEFTRCQTRVIEAKNLDVVKAMLSVDKKTVGISGDYSGTDKMFQQEGSTKYSSWESDDMEITKSQTVAIDAKSLHTVNESQNKKRKSLSLKTTTTTCASKDECDMVMTKPLTASVDHFTLSGGSEISNLPLQIKLCKTDCETVTSTLGADSDDMEFTRCQTRVIEAKNLDVIKAMLSVDKKTVGISGDYSGTDKMFQQERSTKYSSWESDDMEMTKSQTVAIDAKNPHTVNEPQNKKRKSLSLRTTTTTCASKDKCDMDMTKPLTASVANFNLSGGSEMSNLPLQVKLCETVTSTFGADSDEMEFTSCQTGMIEAKNLDVVKPMLSVDKKTVRISGDDNGTDKMFEQEGRTKHSSWESDDMEITKSQTVAIDAESLHPMYASQNKKRKTNENLSFMTALTKATRASKEECDMDMTKPLTVSFDNFEVASSTSGADSNDMEFTRCQTRVIEAKNLEAVKSSLNSMVEGSLDILDSKRKLVSERNEKEMTQNLTSAIVSNDSQDVSDSFQNKTNAKVSTERGHKSQPLTLHLNGMDFKKSHPIAVNSETTGMENQICKTPNLREKIASSDQTSCAAVKCSSATTGFSHKEDNISLSACMVSEEDEMEASIASKINNEQLDEQRNASDGSPLTEGPIKRSFSLPVSIEPMNMENGKDPELTHTNSLPPVFESLPNVSPGVHQVDKLASRNAKTTRMSLVDLQSKLKQMGYMTNVTTGKISVDSCTVSELEMTSDKNPIKTKSLSVVENDCEIKLADKEEHAQSYNHTTVEDTCRTAPLNLMSKCLTSRISVGSFKPKLPQRGKPPKSNTVESSGVNSLGDHLKVNTGDFTHQRTSNILVENIKDEVLLNISSDEDFSGTPDTNIAQKICGKEGLSQWPSMEVSLENEAFEESSPTVTHVGKMCFALDEDPAVDVKRKKPSIDNIPEMGQSLQVDECSTGSPAPSINTQTIDPSNSSNTAGLGYETSESTFKQSLFATQLQDCTSDIQKKLDDGSITVLEFFNLFNLDFVIHNPRQSILPGKVASELDLKPEDLLKDRYINHPKQRVYEMDNQFLTEKVEGLKARMKDREKLLRHVNPRLWEEMRSFTEEELKRFGAKLKEKNNFFRKKSKVESHKLKGVLYSNLLRASKNEQQKLRGKLEESDVMLKDLDDCIQHLQAELNAVEGNGLEDSKPTLESAEQGLAAVTKSLADNERQIYELEVQKTCNLDKLKRLKTETQNLENHTDMLHRITEWKFEEKQGNFQVYSFLHKTLVLQVVFEKCDGDEAPERTISDIIFKFSLDERVSPCHAHLVHKLLSQYTEGETAWVKKYPTSKYIPKLLHDVGLVVSRCRLLGEEVRRLKLFGAMSLNILDISCVDTQVRLLFSSLEAFVKFELSVALTAAYPFCDPQVQNYKNHIGNTTVHQIEEIVSSVTPAKNLLTKIVKKINEDLLSGTPR